MLAPTDLKPIGPWVKGMIVDYVGTAKSRQRRYDLTLRRWYVVQTEPQQESKVEKLIADGDFEALLPTVPKKVRIVGERYRQVMRPMLVGYLFARFDPDNEPWQAIRFMRGVLRLFMIDERPVPVGEREIQCVLEAMRLEREGKRRKVDIIEAKPGDFVRVKDGPFASFFGFVTEIDQKHSKIKAEIDIFGRSTPVEFEADQLDVVLDSPKGLAPTSRPQYRLPRSPR